MKLDLGFNKNAIRMLTGLLLGWVVTVCLIYGKLVLLGLLIVVMAFVSREYVKILNHKGFYPSLKVIYAIEAILAIIVYFERFDLVPNGEELKINGAACYEISPDDVVKLMKVKKDY